MDAVQSKKAKPAEMLAADFWIINGKIPCETSPRLMLW